jgi:hypothetical protein
MTLNPDSTIKIRWSPTPGTAEGRRFLSSVRPSLYAAWAMFAVSLFLPTFLGIPGYQFVGGTAQSVALAFTGDVNQVCAACLFFPNVAMLLSPLLLLGSARRGFLMKVLPVLGIIGALVAILETALLTLLSGGGCGGTSSGGGILGFGSYLWALAIVVLAVGLVRTRMAEASVK